MKTTGKYLKFVREARGLTQKDVAELTGLPKRTIERWEAGQNEPALSDLQLFVFAVRASLQRVVVLLLDKNEDIPDEELREAAQKDTASITTLPPELEKSLLMINDLSVESRRTVAEIVRRFLNEEVLRRQH